MFDEPALLLAASQHGAVARWQLRTAGMSFSGIQQLDASRHWRAVTKEVLVREGSAATTAQRLMISVLDAGPRSYVSHLSGANRWGRPGCALFPVHVVRLGSSRRTSRLARTHRVRSLPDHWVTRLEDIPIVRPELLSMQLFAVCSFERAERLTDRLWSDRLLSGPSLRRFLDEYGGVQGRNGAAGVRAYLDARGPDYIPPASGLEGRFMELMDAEGIAMRRQVDSGAEHWTGRVDFRHPALPLIVEIQSERFHTALCDREADALRTKQLELDGFVVLEITDTQVWASPAETVRRVRDAIKVARDKSL